MNPKSYTTIDGYIADFPENVALILNKIRKCIQESAPNAEETISYNMPAFKQKKILVYFAAFKNHIGFYALPSGNEAFQKELSAYKTGKGSIQFPLKEDIPYDLIRKIVKFRIQEISV
jgi:uncharacterized protein YdhG (YjbR/CyaY superfamily)